MAYNPFVLAKPVWAKGMVDEKNCNLGFYRAIECEGGKATLSVATAAHYRLMINGEFYYYGPARTAEGFFRVDELEIPLEKGVTHLAFWVINPRVASYGLISQPAFFQAELSIGDEVLAATGSQKDFSIFELRHRVKRIQRYSFQRPFAEGYKLNLGFNDWSIGKAAENAVSVQAELQEEKVLIPRGILPNTFSPATPCKEVSRGTVSFQKPEEYYRHFCLTEAGVTIQGFKFDELEWVMGDEAQNFKNTHVTELNSAPSERLCLGENQFSILALEGERTGFIAMDINCRSKGTIYLTFDEILCDGDVNSYRMDCCNVIRLDCEEGLHRFVSMECYGFKYLKLTAASGDFEISDLHLKQYICPTPLKSIYLCEDKEINKIIDAAKWTFLQNSADMFMDCPTRERAGWLCDSFFIGRSEFEFTGSNAVEHNYLENYLLREDYLNVPKGMVPMCYPSDHGGNSFIPNWALWFILELAEHLERTGDQEFINKFEPKVLGILDWFSQYENSDGLLEKVPGWVFVEWSAANSFTKDINFPTNMLYALALECVAELFGKKELCAKADNLKKTIRERSFDGTFFHDNEILVDGVATKTENRTETCQYYAFFTGVATPSSYPELWNLLLTDFGPERAKTGLHPEIHPSNAFIGNHLRLMLLVDNGLNEQFMEECKGFYLYMAERTGTLWEFISTEASCNHGFASHAACMIKRAHQGLNK